MQSVTVMISGLAISLAVAMAAVDVERIPQISPHNSKVYICVNSVVRAIFDAKKSVTSSPLIQKRTLSASPATRSAEKSALYATRSAERPSSFMF